MCVGVVEGVLEWECVGVLSAYDCLMYVRYRCHGSVCRSADGYV